MATSGVNENCQHMCRITPKGVRVNLKNFVLISCGVMVLLRKVSQGERSPSPVPGEIRLKLKTAQHFSLTIF